jgi:ketosteroid isomerase-like protein
VNGNGPRRPRYKLYVLVVLLLGVVFLAVFKRNVLEPLAKSSDRVAIQQVLTDQAAAWNEGNLERFMTGYWNSPEVSFFSDKGEKRGWDELLERYRQRYQAEGQEMGQLTFSDLNIEVLNTDSAWVRGRWQLVMKDKTVGGLFTLFFKKKPEGWRIIHDHTS